MRDRGYDKVYFGQLQEFQPESETIAAYLEYASVYFQANSIAEEKQVAVFLSVIGAKILLLTIQPYGTRQTTGQSPKGPCRRTQRTFSAKADHYCRMVSLLSSTSSSRRIASLTYNKTTMISYPL